MGDIIKCTICGKELEKKTHQIVFRKYMPRPIYNYKNLEIYDLCDKCFNQLRYKIVKETYCSVFKDWREFDEDNI